jgi:hypothetical protein
LEHGDRDWRIMAYITEAFETSEQRNDRWQVLRRTHNDVIRYSDVIEGEDKLKYIVAYPVPLTPEVKHDG